MLQASHVALVVFGGVIVYARFVSVFECCLCFSVHMLAVHDEARIAALYTSSPVAVWMYMYESNLAGKITRFKAWCHAANRQQCTCMHVAAHLQNSRVTKHTVQELEQYCVRLKKASGRGCFLHVGVSRPAQLTVCRPVNIRQKCSRH